MVKSMTGYGRAKQTLNGRDITVEVRSVNNRYLDCTVKMPRAYIFAEVAVKGCVQKAISRGRWMCSSPSRAMAQRKWWLPSTMHWLAITMMPCAI